MTRKGSRRARTNGKNGQENEFQHLAGQATQGPLSEFIGFVLHNKKWWMIPLLVSLSILGLAAFLMGYAGGAAPFIYALF
jgi:hypothetical protein